MQRSVALFLLFCNSCYQGHLYVQQEWVDRNSLASSQIGTPDPRQKDPPEGQKLLIGWDFPRSLFQENLSLAITVRLWDDTQRTLSCPVDRKRGYTSLYFPKNEQGTNKKILTYRIEVMSDRQKKVIEVWEHQLWTELIDVDKNL